MSVESITITNTRPEHAEGVSQTICAAYRFEPADCKEHTYILQPEDILNHVKQFPEGQFVALDRDRVVGMAATMRVDHPPQIPPLKWLDAIGGLSATKHDPNGEWLYGIEFSVRPEYQGRGIGIRLYEVRFEMIKRLNLRGFYAGGMLIGYHRYKDQMNVVEYGERVKAGEIRDPTVSMQMHRGFEAVAVIEDYLVDPWSGNAAMLIVWKNPDYMGKK